MPINNLITDIINIKVVSGASEAPHYGKPGFPKPEAILKITDAIVVGRGMASGAPQVDLQLKDENGKLYVVLATGGILEMLAGVIKSKRELDALTLKED